MEKRRSKLWGHGTVMPKIWLKQKGVLLQKALGRLMTGHIGVSDYAASTAIAAARQGSRALLELLISAVSATALGEHSVVHQLLNPSLT